jgi:5'-nucleotidase
MRRKRIGVDMDGVVADLHSEWLKRYNYDYNDNLKSEDVTMWNWHKLTHPNCQEKIYEYLDDPGLFENLPVIKGSQEVIEELSRSFDIYFITSPFNLNNIAPKYRWLKKNFGFIAEDRYIFTRDKSVFYGDYLIDDKPSNLVGFQGIKILYSAPHNKHNDNSEFIRAENWREIKRFLFKSETY